MKLARLLALVTALSTGPAAWAQWSAAEAEQLFGQTTWGPSEWFGQAMDRDGDTLVVGAPGLDHPSGTNAIGYVHVFERNAEGVWNQIQLIQASNYEAFATFGDALDLDGDTLAVGAPFEGSSGAVYVYTRTGGGPFAEVAKLDRGQSGFGLFGDALALDGDTLVVGDPVFFNNHGRAHVFERDLGGPDAWGEALTLPKNVSSGNGGDFGEAIALSGDTLAIAAPRGDDVHVFERDQGGAGNWGAVTVLAPTDPHPNGSFGFGLALDGDTLAATASLAGPKSAGEINLFERHLGGPDAWGALTQVQGSGLQQFAAFAMHLSLDGDLLVAGTPSIFSQDVGVAHVFFRNQDGLDAWGEVARLDPAGNVQGDDFGTSVAVQGGEVWVGAPFDDDDGLDAGSVYGFDVGYASETYCTAGTSAAGCAASIGSAGTASATAASGFDLTASAVEGTRNGLFFYGANGRQANPWGNGSSYQCVVPPIKRTGGLIGIGTAGQCDGAFTFDLNARWCPGCPKPSHNPGPGALVQAQLWYRDPLSTSSQTTSLSDALEFLVAP